ncbi:unnamed protein product, partial [Rotaria sp. Silwood1]
MLLLSRVNIIYGFDAGFIELSSSRQNDKDTTHYGITVCALCRVTIDYLKSAYNIDTTYLEIKFNEINGQCQGNIVNDIINLLRSSQAKGINPWLYSTTIKTIASANTKTDLKEMFKEESHFDSETFVQGSKLIMKRYQTILDAIIKVDNYDQGRKTFGEMLHTIQDFYSHTNFIELEYTSPSDVLGKRIFQENEYAPINMRTCISCTGQQCQINTNLDENIQKNKLLTSGYFIPIGFNLFKKSKPKGKCSHGGSFDSSQNDEPIGGINKDKLNSVHGHLHSQAASMAYKATLNILTQLRKDIGDESFGLFLTLKKNLNSLIISIDTSCSIDNYIDLAKDISTNIINQYGQLEFAPHNYILISFNSDYAKLIINSRNPNDLITSLQKLNSCEINNSTLGQMYYHSLVEGLKQSESSSVFYTFTDSPARDAYFKYKARALLRNKHLVIYSFLGQQIKKFLFKRQFDLIDQLDGNDDDTDLASISGGLTYPISVNDRPVILEFMLQWTKLQNLVIVKSNLISITFHVDSSIDELHIDISSIGEITDISQITLYRPDNSLYPLTTNLNKTKHLYMWKILQPHVGQWRLTTSQLLQEFDHNVQIQGKSSIVCSSSLQKEMEANPDSNGYTELTTEPLINSSLLILTTCENVNFTYANISLINSSGQTIESYLPLQSDHIEILTKIRVPQQPFRIQTILQLANGIKIQRSEKQLISPTMFTIELINQPYMLSVGETIQMNYTINTSLSEQVRVRLQISDTLNLMGSDGIEKNLTFTKEISQMNLFTLPKDFQEKSINDMVIFALSTYNNKTNKVS